mgnify:CR=1 FL=1|tara:strand:- start:356 stop:1663 length:1308 start_codon:yes stop_codon:yes gene_type:complete
MILYLIKSFLLSGLLYSIYLILLRRSGLFNFNRFYLLISIAILLFWPFANFQLNTFESPTLIQEGIEIINSIQENQPTEFKSHPKSASFPFSKYVLMVYVVVSTLLFFRFLYHLILILNSKPIDFVHQRKIYQAHSSTPYSFFNRLFWPNQQAYNQAIFNHEEVHIKQLHSIDICILELALCFAWFNPILWMFGKSIRENHEFLADHGSIQNIETADYLKLIIQAAGKSKTSHLSHSFSYLSIKNRIKMIQNHTKSKTKRTLILLLSLFAVSFILLGFSVHSYEINEELNQQTKTNFHIDLLEAPKGLPIERSKIKKFSSPFGERTNPITKDKKLHRGIDLIAPAGTPILASAKGKVVKAEYSEGYGNHIVIQHNEKYSTKYAHMKSLAVKVGDEVEAGSTIGVIGTTGRSMSIHLHFEVLENGSAVNPLNFIEI